MAYVLPIGVEDPDDEWEDEVNTLDDLFETFATRHDLPYDMWSGFLVFSFPLVMDGNGRLFATVPEGNLRYDLDFYDGSEWHEGYEEFISEGYYYSFWLMPEYPLTKIRYRFKHFGAGGQDIKFRATNLNVSCYGPLKDLCAFLHQVGSFFLDLSGDIVELWLIGGFLSAPFELLGELFYTGADTCCVASGALQAVLDTVAEGFTADALLALILDNWPTLYYLITDPVGWFLVQLTLAFDLEPWHTQSLEFLSKWIVQEYFSVLYDFYLDPSGEIVRWVSQYSSFVAGLFIDPAKQIRWTIGEILGILPGMYDHPEAWPEMLFEGHFPALYAFWLDPEDWLAEHVDPRILGLPATVAAFFDDPWGWLFDKLEDQIEAYAERIGNIALEIVARLLGV